MTSVKKIVVRQKLSHHLHLLVYCRSTESNDVILIDKNQVSVDVPYKSTCLLTKLLVSIPQKNRSLHTLKWDLYFIVEISTQTSRNVPENITKLHKINFNNISIQW